MVSLPEITMFVLCVAFTGLLVLEPLSKHHPVTAAAATAATLIVVPTTYLMGVTLVVRFPGMRHGVMCPASPLGSGDVYSRGFAVISGEQLQVQQCSTVVSSSTSEEDGEELSSGDQQRKLQWPSSYAYKGCLLDFAGMRDSWSAPQLSSRVNTKGWDVHTGERRNDMRRLVGWGRHDDGKLRIGEKMSEMATRGNRRTERSERKMLGPPDSCDGFGNCRTGTDVLSPLATRIACKDPQDLDFSQPATALRVVLIDAQRSLLVCYCGHAPCPHSTYVAVPGQARTNTAGNCACGASAHTGPCSVPAIVVLALGAGALGGFDTFQLLFAYAGRKSPIVDIAICVFVIAVLTAQLLATVLLVRFVRKAPPPPTGARDEHPTDYVTGTTLLLSLAAALTVTACLVLVPGGAPVRVLVDFAPKCFPFVITASAGALLLPYAMPPLLRRVVANRGPWWDARGGAAPGAGSATTTTHHAAARFVVIVLTLVAAVCACCALVAVPLGGLDTPRRISHGGLFTNTLVAGVVAASAALVVGFYRGRARNAGPLFGGGDAVPAPATADDPGRLVCPVVLTHPNIYPEREAGGWKHKARTVCLLDCLAVDRRACADADVRPWAAIVADLGAHGGLYAGSDREGNSLGDLEEVVEVLTRNQFELWLLLDVEDRQRRPSSMASRTSRGMRGSDIGRSSSVWWMGKSETLINNDELATAPEATTRCPMASGSEGLVANGTHLRTERFPVRAAPGCGVASERPWDHPRSLDLLGPSRPTASAGDKVAAAAAGPVRTE
ncbi:hypothetical protein HU200_019651 [Digitaria exilis]|uniref:Uncharacterized protein n=1 Tax=Digitaria exilis TaxID=1010633 RepID=A0A835KGF0_9POAL|nr:hypothetical protein HU200_019651 [Digitaria exilis]